MISLAIVLGLLSFLFAEWTEKKFKSWNLGYIIGSFIGIIILIIVRINS
jgi:hypothetical protein